MDPSGQLAAIVAIEMRRLNMLAIYHSHPAGSRTDPSPADIVGYGYPDALMVIIALGDEPPLAILRAFQVDGSLAAEVTVNLVT